MIVGHGVCKGLCRLVRGTTGEFELSLLKSIEECSLKVVPRLLPLKSVVNQLASSVSFYKHLVTYNWKILHQSPFRFRIFADTEFPYTFLNSRMNYLNQH